MSAAYALCRDARRRAAITQRDLATRAGVSQSTIARIERGRMEPTFEVLNRLVEACGLELRISIEPIDPLDRTQAPSDLASRLASVKNLSRFATLARAPRG